MTQTRMEATEGKEGSRCFEGRAHGIYCWVQWDVGGWEVGGGSEGFSLEATGWAGLLCTETGRWGKVQVWGVCQEKCELSRGHPGGVGWDTLRRAQC